jgi:LIM homeobox protein 2/9
MAFIEIFSIPLELMNASELNSGNMELSSYDGSQSPRSGGAMTPNSRNKRMRTSFKHHQLRTMKSYFAINQNPDAKDLKQLAQKTGLSKRVLQVWFQNARAKWRRNVMRQDGSMQNSSCPPNITSYSTTDIHTPNSSESEVTPSHTHALEEMHNMSSCMELY